MKKVLLIILAIIILIPLAGYLYLRSYLPDYSGNLNIAGLQEKVRVTRNQFAVPSIQAENLEDLYFAWGYVNAQDRLFQMELTKRIGQGRISEFAGESQISSDIFLRAVGFYELAKQAAENLSDKHSRFLQRYVDGVNYYLANEKAPLYFSLLGIEKETWTPADSIVVGMMLNWDLAYNMDHEFLYHKIVARLGETQSRQLQNLIPFNTPTIAAKKPACGTTDAAYVAMLNRLRPLTGCRSASNNWVLAPSKTENSGPILANDLHLGTKMPADIYLIHVKAGDFEVTGGQVVGLPFAVMGYNQQLAWGVTNQGADLVDVFFETVDWDKKTYRRQGTDLPLRTKEVEIRVKDREPVNKTLYYAGRRPLLHEVFTEMDQVVSLDWAAYDGVQFAGFFELNEARNYSEFLSAAKKIGITPQNMVYADIKGNIAYRTVGMLVKRKSDTGNYPQKGESVETNWEGLLDPEQFPALVNPNRGFIITANNKIVRDFPIDMNGTYSPRYRYDAIARMLEGRQKIDVDYVKQMQCDTHSVLAGLTVPLMKKYVQTADEPEAQQVFEALTAWDGNARVDSAAASIYNTWLLRFMVHTYVDELGEALAEKYVTQRYISLERFLSQLQNNSAFFDDVATPQKETPADIATRAYEETLQILADFTGSQKTEDWTWGKLHPVTFEHFLGKSRMLRPLVNYGPFPMGGDCETNLRAHFYSTQPPYQPTLAAAVRMIVEFNPTPKGYLVLVSGQNEYFLSKHYTDLTDMWLKGEYFCFEEEEAEYELIMTPSSG